ncbi:MAG: TlpA disulfide reductase family protein [Candidatus Omnitrophica bacterium]|nr:TlpA disulfide reductase family protein [Candidatus Omnitrophota bacterium]
MKKYFGNLVTVLLIFLSVSCVWAQEPSSAVNFKLPDMNGNMFNLGDCINNKEPVILFFWTTWCPYCQIELRSLNEIYPQFKKEGIKLVSIDIGEPGDKVDSFIKAYKLNFKVLLDGNSAVAKSYGILGVPTYILIDRNGKIRATENSFPKDKYKELILK